MQIFDIRSFKTRYSKISSLIKKKHFEICLSRLDHYVFYFELKKQDF